MKSIEVQIFIGLVCGIGIGQLLVEAIKRWG